jgi:hypothetical protein
MFPNFHSKRSEKTVHRLRSFLATAALALIFIGICFAQEPTFVAGKQALKKNGKTNLKIAFAASETDWKLSCSGVDLMGWASPFPVTIDTRNSDTGYYREVSGKQFKAGAKVNLQVRRIPGTTKQQSGECRLESTVAGNTSQSLVKFTFR